MIVGSMLLLGALCASASIYSLYTNSKGEWEHLRSLLISERKDNLRDLVSGAYSVLNTANFYEPAQKALTEMRFGEGNKNYFFVVDTDAMFWVYPIRPELVGKVEMEMVDAEGTPYIRQLIDGAKNTREGFIQYKEFPEGEENALTRLVYFKYFEKWQWIVCAGMYINDIESILAQKEKEIKSTMMTQLTLLGGMMGIALLLGCLISSKLISNRVIKPLITIKTAAERIGQGDFSNTLKVNGAEEIRQLAKSINTMQTSLDKSLKMTRKMIEKQKITQMKKKAGPLSHSHPPAANPSSSQETTHRLKNAS